MTDEPICALAPTRTRQKATSRSLTARWTDAEDHLLVNLLNSEEHPQWISLPPYFPGKTSQQIAERWFRVLDPALVKGSWTRQEDEAIMAHVSQFGPRSWAQLANRLPGRIGKQCRERWRNHLDPHNNNKPWTDEEDLLLMQLHKRLGNQWVKMASMMEGRSDNHLKNRWNTRFKNKDPVARAECTTPRQRASRESGTPDSPAQMPKPTLEDPPISEEIPAMPSLAWTPVANESSPGPNDKSPFTFGSPVIRANQTSPWFGDFLKLSNLQSMYPLGSGEDAIGRVF
jgi:hypothetical protein